MRSTYFILVAAVLVGHHAPGQVAEKSPLAVITIGSENPNARLGGRVYIKSLVKNIGLGQVQISRIHTDPRFLLTMRNQDGRELPRTTYYGELQSRPAYGDSTATLGPGQNILETIELSKYFVVSQPGTYTAQLSRQAWDTAGTIDKITSNSVVIRILGRDSTQGPTDPSKAISSRSALFPDEYPASIKVRASEAPQELTLHEPVITKLMMHNTTNQKVNFLVGEYGESDYRVSVLMPDGERSEIFEPHEMVSRGEQFSAEIEPGADHIQEILLNRWVSFDQEGAYTIALFIPQSIEPAVFHVLVGPRRQARLAEVATDLMNTAKGRRTTLALTALASMHDDVGVDRLKTFDQRSLALQGLAIMENPAAIRALADFLSDPDRELASVAESKLTRLAQSTKDVAVKEAASEALKRR